MLVGPVGKVRHSLLSLTYDDTAQRSARAPVMLQLGSSPIGLSPVAPNIIYM